MNMSAFDKVFIILIFNIYNVGGTVEEVKTQLNLHQRKVRDDSSYLAGVGGPVAASGRDGDSDSSEGTFKCLWEIHNQKILMGAYLAMVKGKGAELKPHSNKCSTANDCKAICENIGCNYFTFAINENSARFYDLPEKMIREEHFFHSAQFNSYSVYCRSICSLAEVIDPGCPDCDLRELFVRFMHKYGKRYDTDEEFEKRFKQFKLSINSISDMNKLRSSDQEAAFGITKFTDASYDDFLSASTGSLPQTLDNDNSVDNPELIDIAEKCPKWDWASTGVIPPVRDQGKCGCCYGFSSADLLAAQYHIDRKLWNKTALLSPQYIVDCFTDPAAFGCKGGRPVKVLQNITTFNLPRESCYPFRGVKDQCRDMLNCMNDSFNFQTKWSTILSVDGIAEKKLMAAYLRHGPMVVIVDASKAWQFYNGTGIIRGRSCSTKTNHAVLMTGYDYTGPTPYYIIKNSWGTSWGNDGYLKLQAGKNACGVAQTLTVTCTANCEKLKTASDPLCQPNSFGCSYDLPETCKRKPPPSAT